MKKFWVNFKLKMSLLKIWLLKNLLLFVEIAFLVLLILIFTGVINQNTAFFGTVEPFKSLVKAIGEATAGKYETAIAVLGSIASVLISILMFTVRAKSIAQADIKDDKLKYALIQAKLYFNSDGRLVKKIEKATGRDLDKDGKVDDGTIAKVRRKNIISRAIGAVKEFILIVTTDFTEEDTKSSERYNKILEDADMENAAEAADEIDEILSDGTLTAGETISQAEAEKAESDELIEPEAKEEKIVIFSKLSSWFKDKKEAAAEKRALRKQARAEAKAQRLAAKQAALEAKTLENNMEEDLNKTEASTPAPTKETKKATVQAVSKPSEPQAKKQENSVDSFLASLNHR